MDESGICHKLQRTHGYGKVGERVYGLIEGKRQKRTNIIGAWSSCKKLFATNTYDTSVNKKVFIDWIKNHLVKHLKKGLVVIMDNAPWHRGTEIRKQIEDTGAKLVMLAPYSPDLNPIEHAWANLKQAIKSNKKYFDSFFLNLKSQLFLMDHSNLN